MRLCAETCLHNTLKQNRNIINRLINLISALAAVSRYGLAQSAVTDGRKFTTHAGNCP